MVRNKGLLMGLAILAVAIGGGLAWWMRPHEFVATVLDPPMEAYDFELSSVHGPVRLSDFRGKWVLLFFGYTHCPDVCPTTLADLDRVMQLLGNEADKVQVIMITVDPQRDTPERMDKYVKFYNERFIGLSGTEAQIQEVAAKFGVYYEKHESQSAAGYLVDHSAFVLLVDPQGRLKAIFPPTFGEDGITPEEMAADLKYLIP